MNSKSTGGINSVLEAKIIDPSLLHQYQKNKFVHLRKIVRERTLALWLEETHDLPTKRVRVNTGGISNYWNEQEIRSNQSVYDFFASYLIGSLVTTLYKTHASKPIIRMKVWTSVYHAQEFIGRHKDREGCLQAILCLSAPEKHNGGALLVENSLGCKTIFLKPGDFFVFQASSLYHQTTPLVVSNNCPLPMRKVVVARYFST